MIKIFTIAIVSFFYSTMILVEKPTQHQSPPNAALSTIDTSRVFYFSFPENRLIDMENAKEKTIKEKMDVCQGAKVILEAPVFYANAKYYWEGPAGFRSYLPNVILDHVSTKQSGTYKVWVENSLVQTLGSIDLNVNKNTIPRIIQSERGKLIKYKAFDVKPETLVYWIDTDNHIIGPKNELVISTDQKSKGDWFVLIKNKDCDYSFKL
jgi:hypothetical protein